MYAPKMNFILPFLVDAPHSGMNLFSFWYMHRVLKRIDFRLLGPKTN